MILMALGTGWDGAKARDAGDPVEIRQARTIDQKTYRVEGPSPENGADRPGRSRNRSRACDLTAAQAFGQEYPGADGNLFAVNPTCVPVVGRNGE